MKALRLAVNVEPTDQGISAARNASFGPAAIIHTDDLLPKWPSRYQSRQERSFRGLFPALKAAITHVLHMLPQHPPHDLNGWGQALFQGFPKIAYTLLPPN